jgi:hypothetical protein
MQKWMCLLSSASPSHTHHPHRAPTPNRLTNPGPSNPSRKFCGTISPRPTPSSNPFLPIPFLNLEIADGRSTRRHHHQDPAPSDAPSLPPPHAPHLRAAPPSRDAPSISLLLPNAEPPNIGSGSLVPDPVHLQADPLAHCRSDRSSYWFV